MLTRCRRGAVLLLLLAGCGTAAPGAAPTTGISERDRPAPSILADSRTALAHASSYRVTGMLERGIGIDAEVSGASVRGTMTDHGISWQFVAVDQQVYVRGAALWHATEAAPIAAALGDHWVRAVAATAYSTTALMRLIGTDMDTILAPRPGLTVVAIVTLHRPGDAIKISNGTDEYEVSSTGTPYPLRWVDLTESTPNAVCGLSWSAFDQPLTITAPAGAIPAPAS